MPFKMKGHTLPGINQKGNKTVKGAVPKMYADKAAPAKMYDAPAKKIKLQTSFLVVDLAK